MRTSNDFKTATWEHNSSYLNQSLEQPLVKAGWTYSTKVHPVATHPAGSIP